MRRRLLGPDGDYDHVRQALMDTSEVIITLLHDQQKFFDSEDMLAEAISCDTDPFEPEELLLLQLCDETSRRIAQTPPPVTAQHRCPSRS